ncbi:hypothetical protein HPB47_025486 [Ixodes persulcatus]|uniref:Uncharacterized protein n=1 Tax=Ixodes persulcatus TaxID=34615 RepID=A0AC60Q1F9_IXOPE|nr:hypothetical protein HPB47_025486 [Ixodes persulcatus]
MYSQQQKLAGHGSASQNDWLRLLMACGGSQDLRFQNALPFVFTVVSSRFRTTRTRQLGPTQAVCGHRPKLDVTKEYTERNFVTPVRVMSEYMLKPRALEMWGSYDAIRIEQQRRRDEELKYRESMSNVKSILKEYQRAERASQEAKRRETILKGSGRVVQTAVVINGLNFAFKGIAWFYTGSHCMFAEAIHSLSDTCNQLILSFGIHKSIQEANPDHPYGYHNMRYVSSLISGVGVFFFGAGLAWYHGIKGLLHPEELESLYWPECEPSRSNGTTAFVLSDCSPDPGWAGGYRNRPSSAVSFQGEGWTLSPTLPGESIIEGAAWLSCRTCST